MTVDVHDDRKGYCRMLGHEVAFKYCRAVQEGVPCRNILDCWFEKFDVQKYLNDHYTPEQIKVMLAPPKAKITSLIELIEQARKTKDI